MQAWRRPSEEPGLVLTVQPDPTGLQFPIIGSQATLPNFVCTMRLDSRLPRTLDPGCPLTAVPEDFNSRPSGSYSLMQYVEGLVPEL